jgi:hypothetical protein
MAKNKPRRNLIEDRTEAEEFLINHHNKEKEELRLGLMQSMCDIAQNISVNRLKYETMYLSIYCFNGEWPKAIKPGVFEKFIFKDIINQNIDDIYTSRKLSMNYPVSVDNIACNLMIHFYYGVYGTNGH